MKGLAHIYIERKYNKQQFKYVCTSHQMLCMWCFLTVLYPLNRILTYFWISVYSYLLKILQGCTLVTLDKHDCLTEGSHKLALIGSIRFKTSHGWSLVLCVWQMQPEGALASVVAKGKRQKAPWVLWWVLIGKCWPVCQPPLREAKLTSP